MLTSGSAAQARQVDLLVEIVRAALVREGASLGLDLPVSRPDLTGLDARAFCAAVHGHRVSSLVAAHGDALGLPAAVMDDIQEQASQQALMSMTLAQETPRVLGALADAGIPALAFKGVALSQLATGTATERGGGDIDVLVHEDHVPAALDLLLAQGMELDVFTRAQAAHWWPLIRWSTRELLLLGTPAQVDVHWSITQEHDLLPPTVDQIARAQVVEVLGAPIATLSDDDTLLAACYHLHHDAYRSLRHAVDVIRLLRRRTAPVAWRGRQGAMAGESARFAASLIGGLSRGHLDALDIPQVPITPALQQWKAHRCDPMTRNRPTGAAQTFRVTRDSYRHSRFARELPRIASTYALMRLAPRLDSPITVAGIARALRGPS